MESGGRVARACSVEVSAGCEVDPDSEERDGVWGAAVRMLGGEERVVVSVGLPGVVAALRGCVGLPGWRHPDSVHRGIHLIHLR